MLTGTGVVCAEKLIMAPAPSAGVVCSVIEYGEAREVIVLVLPLLSLLLLTVMLGFTGAVFNVPVQLFCALPGSTQLI
jgi:hypothetical protein